MGETAGRGTAAGRTRRSAPFTFAMAASSQPPRAARSLLAVLLVTFGVSFVLYFDGVAKLRRNSIALEKVTDLPNFSKFSSFRSNRGATTAAAPPAAAGPTEPSPTCYHLRRVAVPGWQSCVMHCALPFISQIDAPQHAQRHVGGAVHAAEVAFPALRDLFRNVHLSQWQRQRSSTVDDRMPKRGVGAAIPPSLPPPPSNRVYIIDIAPKSLPLTNIWHWLVVVAPLYRWLRENLDAGVAMDTITIHFPLLEGLEPDSWQAGMLDLVRIAASASAPSPSRAAIAFGHTLDDRPALVTWTNAAATNTFFCRNALFYAADARAAAQLRAAADAEWPPPLPSPTPALASSAAPPLSTIGAFNKVVFLLRGNRDGSKSGEVHGSGRALINVNALVEFARQWTIRNGATLVVAYTAEHGSFVDQIELFRSARVVIRCVTQSSDAFMGENQSNSTSFFASV